MSNTRRARRPRRSSSTPQDVDVDVVSQLECAACHPAAAAMGGALGGAIPWFARALAHGELPRAWADHAWPTVAIELVVVAGCVLFSVLTVYRFGRAAFGSPRKAAGFVAALEGVMLVSHGTTSLVALALLVAINCIANGCGISLARAATLRRREADGRRSATRANNRVQKDQQARQERESPATTAPATRRRSPARGAIVVARAAVAQPVDALRWSAESNVVDAEYTDAEFS